MNDRAGKMALLTELLGASHVAELNANGTVPDGGSHSADPSSIAWHQNRLIEKFREKGLLNDTPQRRRPEPAGPSEGRRKLKPDMDFAPGGVGARLAKHLNPDRLSDEHPAVIAMLLKSQTPELRSEVLRGLPGNKARAVMRILRAMRGEARAEKGSENLAPKASEKVAVEADKAKNETPSNDLQQSPKRRPAAGTRRAR